MSRCVSRSTCGRLGAVTCCRTLRGVSHCRIKTSAAACRAPHGGTACVGTFTSCCDACTAGGCALPTTTTTTSSTTTTLPLVECGVPLGCGVACPQSSTCQRIQMTLAPAGLHCVCIPDDLPPCGAGPFPQCAGACPGTSVCALVIVTDAHSSTPICGCIETNLTCGYDAQGTCAVGLCPGGAVCSVSTPDTVFGCGCSL